MSSRALESPAGEALRATDLAVDLGGRRVLGPMDLALSTGETLVVIGPNGAGKSTLVRALARLVALSQGEVHASGRVAAALQTSALASRDVAANVELALRWWGVHRAERRERARNALREVRAEGLAGRQARSLSGGEARRVHLARALAVRPDVLLLDEPFAGLDVATRADLLYDVASSLRAADRATLVVVHDRAEAWALADRVVVLLEGSVAAQGTPNEIFDHPPTPEVARFVGYVGEILRGEDLVLVRPGDVRVGEGELTGIVRRRVPLEEGIRVELDVPGGHVVALTGAPGPAEGASVPLRIEGGVRFPSGARAGTSAAPSTPPDVSQPPATMRAELP